MANEFEIEGLGEVVRRMRQLSPKLQKRGLRTAIRRGANVVRKAAVANAKRIDDPQTQTAIWRNITVQFASRESRRAGGVVMRVGVRGGAKQYAKTKANVRSGRAGSSYATAGSSSNPGGDTWYWRFIELGTSRQAARPFLRPALANNIGSATNEVVTSLNKEIDKLIAKGVK